MFRYISKDKFNQDILNDRFAIHSGKEDRQYGFYKSDIMSEFQLYDTIILIISYKDIEQLLKLKVNTEIIVLTFKDNISEMVRNRIKARSIDMESREIEIRARYAQYEHDKYFTNIKKESKLVIYTDLYGIDEMVKFVKNNLELEEKEQIII